MSFRQFSITASAALLLAAAASQASAHHSFAMFASDKTVTLTGTVKEFEWSNPHAWLHIIVTTPAGVSQTWAFEMASPAQLSVRGGWKPDTLKVGDKVSVQMHPMKDGSHGGSFMAAILPTGATMGQWQGDKPGA